jgi:hypothetical protein
MAWMGLVFHPPPLSVRRMFVRLRWRLKRTMVATDACVRTWAQAGSLVEFGLNAGKHTPQEVSGLSPRNFYPPFHRA